jgi:hypothetical protein
VNFGQLRHPKRDMLWVAAAGPGANLVMACIWALMLKFAEIAPANYYSIPLHSMARIGITIKRRPDGN